MLLQQLMYFNKIAEFQNVTKAADYLYVSQPTLSRTVRQLEEELGCELFERKGRSLLLTESGQLLLKRSSEILSLLEQTRRELNEMNAQRQTPVIVQLRCIAGRFFEVLADYMALHPALSFCVLQNDNAGIDQSHYDLLLYPSASDVSTESTVTLFTETIYIAMAENHPLAAKPVLEIQDLKGCPFIDVAGTRYFQKISSALLQETGYSPQHRLISDDPQTIRHMVMEHGYLAQMPAFTLGTKELEGLCLRTVKGVPMSRHICLAVNNTRAISPEASAFRQYLLETFSA